MFNRLLICTVTVSVGARAMLIWFIYAWPGLLLLVLDVDGGTNMEDIVTMLFERA